MYTFYSEKRKKILLILIALFFLPHFSALIFSFETWPFSNYPMFAHYVNFETPRYRFRFMGIYEKNQAYEILPRHLAMRNREFTYLFFGKVYGSIDPWAPEGHIADDTLKKFEKRLSQYFSKFVTRLQKVNPNKSHFLLKIRLDVVKLNSQDKFEESHTVGFFDIKTNLFQHTWKT